MSKVTIRRKEYTRKAFTANRRGKKVRVSSAKVRPSTFTIRDRGKPGRGPKLVPSPAGGALGGPGFFNRPHDEQKEIVFRRAKRMGERKVVGELRALQVFFKTIDPRKSRRALQLSKQVAGSFKRKETVGFPGGFRRKD
jgi:hypothetical protein